MGCCQECEECQDCNPCTPCNPCCEETQVLGCTEQIDADCVFIDNGTTILEILNITVNTNITEVLEQLIEYINTTINNYKYEPVGLGGDCIAGGNPFDFDTWLQNLEAYVCTLEDILTFDNALERTLNNIQWGGLLVKDTTVDGDGNTYSVTFDDLFGFDVNSSDHIILNANLESYLILATNPSDPLVHLFSADNMYLQTTGDGIITIEGAQNIIETYLSDIQLNSATDIIANPFLGSTFQIDSDTIKNATAINGEVWTLTDATTGAGEWQAVAPAVAVFTAQNAVNQPVVGTIEWGGTLLHDTQVDGGSTWDVEFLAPADFIVSLATNINLGTVGSNAVINLASGGGGTLEIIAQGSNGNAGQVLTSDGTNATWQDPAVTITADNGLTLTGSNVQLGGLLIQNTSVDGDANSYDMEFTAIKDFTVDTQLLFINLPSNGQDYVLTNVDPLTGEAEWVDITTLVGPSTPHNTLDMAYDEGGAGAGRTIIADTGAVVVAGADGLFVTGTLAAGSTIDSQVTGSGVRMFFNPRTAAFRAGEAVLTSWDDANVGTHSIALGYNPVASGTQAVSIGSDTVASGANSLALGLNTDATATAATALGELSLASGSHSLAGGRSTIASGDRSTAIGEGVYSRSYAETTVGMFNTDYAPSSAAAYSALDRVFTVGHGANGGARSNALTVLKNGDVGLGIDQLEATTQGELLQLERGGGLAIRITDGTEAVGRVLTCTNANGRGEWDDPVRDYIDSITFDSYPSATGNGLITVTSVGGAFSGTIELYQLYNENPSAPIVNTINALAVNSFALGQDNSIVAGVSSGFAIGRDNTTQGADAFTIGYQNNVTNSYCGAIGDRNACSGWDSYALGTLNTVTAAYGIAIGYGNTVSRDWNVACGHNTVNSARYGFTANHATAAYSHSESCFGATPTVYVPFNTTDFNEPDRLFIIARENSVGLPNQDVFTVLKNGRVGINIDNFEAEIQTANEVFHISEGTLRITDGTQGLGQVLTSDADGVGTWQGLEGTISTYPAYANNAAATGGGLVAGQLYRETASGNNYLAVVV